jgi:hypothetical protein
MDTTYNGWKNRQTWNVSLWINNDEPLYRSAVEYVKEHKINKKTGTPNKHLYLDFVKHAGLEYDRTPDGIGYKSTRLDYKALNAMMAELID